MNKEKVIKYILELLEYEERNNMFSMTSYDRADFQNMVEDLIYYDVDKVTEQIKKYFKGKIDEGLLETNVVDTNADICEIVEAGGTE